MKKKYHKKYKSGLDSLIDILAEILIFIFKRLIYIIVTLIYKLFSFIRDLIYKTEINKKTLPNIQTEIEPIPEVHFEKEEEEKEVYLPYKKKSFFLTKAEYNFDKVLREIIGNKYYIERQVPLSSIIEVTSAYKPYRSKIDKKTIDFVLFNKNGYTPYLAIELDDSSHLRLNRIKRDNFVQDVFHKTGIRLLRIKNSYSYDIDNLTTKIIQ